MSKTTTTPANKEDALKGKNLTVQAAYESILKEVKGALPQYPTDYHRTFIEVDYSTLGMSCRHGFFSPLIHLQLEEVDGQLLIRFSRNVVIKQQIGYYFDGLLTRIVYRNTAEAATSVFIEDAVSMEAFNMDDFRQANGLILKGFKGGSKVTV
ncbi:MAG: hypothetical protein JWM44_4479 [Bacilli bacterium]|nr:hypothetical protein [Bacilli bacterium]